jgi:murein DD-endopeptidase MepM/ murein hydrolase activator NlpD
MSDKEKGTASASPIRRLLGRIKHDPTTRAVAITAATLITALAVMISATTIANRAKKPQGNNETTPPANTTGRVEPETEPEETEPVDALPSTFALPVSGALGKGHDPEVQVFSGTMQDYRVHLGIDIQTEEGAPVYASAAGTVSRIWDDVRYGKCVAVSHSGKAVTIYKNLSVDLADGIEEGAQISAGRLIGAVGDTAMVEIADEPHLHFEMTVNGIAVNPLDYFDASALSSLQGDKAYEK